jgi:hypothetical protein
LWARSPRYRDSHGDYSDGLLVDADEIQHDAAIDATNWRAERALRPAVVTRKVCGGNRSWHGADSQQILASVIRTTTQRQMNPHSVLASLLHARTPHVAAELN